MHRKRCTKKEEEFCLFKNIDERCFQKSFFFLKSSKKETIIIRFELKSNLDFGHFEFS